MLMSARPSSAMIESQVIPEQAVVGCLEDTARSGLLYSKVKRGFDIAMVLMAGPAALVLVALIAFVTAILMGRPIFFVQRRVGLNGRVFRMFKLRTMQPCSVKITSATAKNDRRITPLGKVLRQTHLDELPQLWNILRGEMSLIGPRPEQPELVDLYREMIPQYDMRHTVRPGLSGWAQVSFGYAANVDETRNKLKYDLYYVQNFGPAMDMRVAVRTILVYLNPTYVR